MDGCSKGWVVACRDLDHPEEVEVTVKRDLAAILDEEPRPGLIAIDMPIGLPDQVGRGGRTAETLAREIIGPLRSSVFPTSARSVVYARDWAEIEAACAAGIQPFRPSPFARALFGKIRQIDGLLRERPALMDRVFEVHPEVVFARLNGGALADSKRTPPGEERRRALLAEVGIPASAMDARPPGAKPDDVLDALAALVVAEEIAAGHAVPLPNPPERDGCGITMAIWTPGARTAKHSGPPSCRDP